MLFLKNWKTKQQHTLLRRGTLGNFTFFLPKVLHEYGPCWLQVVAVNCDITDWIWLQVVAVDCDITDWMLAAGCCGRLWYHWLNMTAGCCGRLWYHWLYVDCRLLRSTVISLACGNGHQGCLTNARRLFTDWLHNNVEWVTYTTHTLFSMSIFLF